jgi:hypothetical protein
VRDENRNTQSFDSPQTFSVLSFIIWSNYMGLAVDGYAVGSYAGDTCTLTTGGAGDVIVALGYYGNGLVSMSDTAGLTWHTILNTQLGSYYGLIAWAYSASKLTSDAISCGGSGGYTLDAVAISGANTSSPIDADSPASGATSPLSITTAATNTLIIHAVSPSSPPATAGSGWTLLDGGSSNYWALEYIIESSAGTYSCSWGSGTPSDGVAVAIVAASGGGGGGSTLAALAVPRKIYLRSKPKYFIR